MDNARNNDTDLGEQYSEMMLAYYNKLAQKRRGSEKVAAEEIKLRLFLSLLDKPADRDWEGDEMRAAS